MFVCFPLSPWLIIKANKVATWVKKNISLMYEVKVIFYDVECQGQNEVKEFTNIKQIPLQPLHIL